ncbi:MAG: hypothetical protein IT259_03030 [Saprospiraceae bacterium]|nr:hypothetical protein [Saprospiraceae bacterium]
MLKNTFLALILCLTGFGATAQVNTFQNGPVLDFNLALGFPAGEYSDATNDFGLGLNAALLFPVSKKVPILKAGVDFTALWTAWDTERIREQIEVTLNGQVIDIIDLPMRVQTTNTILGGGAVLRVNAPVSSRIEPYVQGLVGFRRFATTIRVYDESDEGFFDTDENGLITTSTPLQDWIFSYGAGAGFQIKLNRQVFLHLGANYLLGGEADYYTKEDVKNFQFNFAGSGSATPGGLDPDDLDLDSRPSRSRTNMIQANIGVTVLIDDLD